ncbi:MAG TPA: DUF4097 family beta strand repeat-containing protein [Pyrinomonadaceae bacterium]|nr:DUF4097 family beta strand repeat-containing protein [Pyrinomonadaceae bacterium]
MKINLGNTNFRFLVLLFAIFCLASPFVLAQDKVKEKSKSKSFCSNNNSWGDRASFRELREMTMPAGSLLTVDGDRNGGIQVKGDNRSDVLVRACVQTWGETDEAARAAAQNVRINTGSVVRAEGASENWSVSYEIFVPRQTNLKLNTQNGGIHISGVEGSMDFEARNGGLHLSDLAGDVKGRTTNGGIHLNLDGNSWRGSGLDLQTTNGGIHLSIPASYAARMELGTTNGGFHSSVNGLALEKRDGERRRPGGRITADLNGGGAPIRLITTNGGVHINSDSDKY